MNSFLAWLLGPEAEKIPPGAKFGIQFNAWPSGAEGWLVFVLAITVIVFTILIYKTDGRDTASPRFRMFLGFLRACILTLALLILTEPSLVARTERVKPSTVVVLIDDSASMSTRFPYADKELQDTIRRALGPDYKVPYTEGDKTELIPTDKLDVKHFAQIHSIQVALQALRRDNEGFFNTLRERGHDVQFFTFSSGLTSKAVNLSEDLKAEGNETQIGSSLNQIPEKLQNVSLAAVIVISDGRQTKGEDPVQVAKKIFRPQQVPVFAVGVGDPSEAKDISIEATGRSEVLPNDPNEIRVEIVHQGYDGLGSIILNMKDLNHPDVHLQDDGKEVKLGKSGEKIVTTLRFREFEPGDYKFEISTPVKPGEISDENNKSIYNFKVKEDKIRVLFIEGQDLPRWEYRYLKNALLRDHSIDADILLAKSDGNFLYDGNRSPALESVPQTKKEMDEYHVIILGDFNPEALTEPQKKLFNEFVTKEGGGLIMIAGERYMPSKYVHDKELTDLLPVVPYDNAEQSPPEGLKEAFGLELTPDGMQSAWTSLDPENPSIKEIWDNLPRMYWFYPVRKLKSTATAIAVHPGMNGEDGKRMPVIAWAPVGAGRSVFIGVDSLWRWRMGVGDKYHYRFYNQALRFASANKRTGGQKRVHLSLDKNVYLLHDKVTVTGVFKDEKFNPLTAERVQARYKAGDAEGTFYMNKKAGDEEGVYEGTFVATKREEYQVSLADDIAPGAKDQRVQFKVNPSAEMENTRLNEQLLRALASAGGDGLVRREAFKLPEAERAVVVRHFLEGKSIKEIADERHISEETVNAQINSGLKIIQTDLTDQKKNIDPEQLKAMLASAQYCHIDQLPLIPPQIEVKNEKLKSEMSFYLWDNWLMLGLFCGIITLEWVLRKRGKML